MFYSSFYFAFKFLQVKYKEDGKKEMSVSFYSVQPETIDTQRAKDVSHLQSEVLSCVKAINHKGF